MTDAWHDIDKEGLRDACLDEADLSWVRGNRKEAKTQEEPRNKYRDALIYGAAIKDLPPPTPLIPGWFDRDTVAVIYGQPGTYKSFWALHCAMTLITSTWHLGDGIYTEKGRVLYAIAEGVAGVGQRIEAWETHYNAKISDALVWLNLPLGLYYATDDEVQQLVDVAVECKPDLMFVDTLSANAIGAEESSNRDMPIVLDRIGMIRRATGATVCAVHHSGWDGKHLRGASALLGNVDTVIRCEGGGGHLTLTVEKQKNHEDGQRTSFRTLAVGKSLVLVEDDNAEPESDELTSADKKVLQALSEVVVAGGVTSTTWLQATDLASRTFYRSRSRLARLGHVTNLGTDKQPRYVVTATATGLPSTANGSAPLLLTATATPLGGGSVAVTDDGSEIEAKNNDEEQATP